MLELRGQRDVQAERRRGSLVEDGAEDFRGSVAGKCRAAGGHFVEYHAKTEKVAASIQFAAARLFGRHLGDSAQCGARAGEIGWIESLIVWGWMAGLF